MTITKTDIQLTLYNEVIEEISREDDELIDTKIAVGMGEIYSYLNRFDTDVMFETAWNDAFLKQICVNVIAWHLATKSNPGVNFEIIRTLYEDALEFLVKVQKGTVRPKWPIRPDDPASPMDEGGNVQWSSNTKRNNHF